MGDAVVVLEVVEGNAELLGSVEEVEDLCVAEERFAGDASPVEADAAQLVPLHDRSLQAKLTCPDGGHIAARPGPDNRYIIIRQLHYLVRKLAHYTIHLVQSFMTTKKTIQNLSKEC